MMAKSLVVVFGASIFLYSEHVLANTVIYDPLNPHNTITPIPNADPEPSEYLIDGEITMESAESTPSQDQKIIQMWKTRKIMKFKAAPFKS